LVLSLANACAVSWWFANKVVEEIESGLLIDPMMKAQGQTCGDDALMLTDGDGFYLFSISEAEQSFHSAGLRRLLGP
jgi:hypothetical protein